MWANVGKQSSMERGTTEGDVLIQSLLWLCLSFNWLHIHGRGVWYLESHSRDICNHIVRGMSNPTSIVIVEKGYTNNRRLVCTFKDRFSWINSVNICSRGYRQIADSLSQSLAGCLTMYSPRGKGRSGSINSTGVQVVRHKPNDSMAKLTP